MTGRRLYELVTDEMYRERAGDTHWKDRKVAQGNFVDDVYPAAWAYLPQNEKDGWNAAAKRIAGKRR